MILSNNSIPIRKKWGQNFLIDQNTISKIIKIIDPKKEDIILEIGPGKGAMTIPLSKRVKNIHAVEIDPMLFNYLNKKKLKNITLKNSDILKYNKFFNYNKIIGNIPYLQKR